MDLTMCLKGNSSPSDLQDCQKNVLPVDLTFSKSFESSLSVSRIDLNSDDVESDESLGILPSDLLENLPWDHDIDEVDIDNFKSADSVFSSSALLEKISANSFTYNILFVESPKRSDEDLPMEYPIFASTPKHETNYDNYEKVDNTICLAQNISSDVQTECYLNKHNLTFNSDVKNETVVFESEGSINLNADDPLNITFSVENECRVIKKNRSYDSSLGERTKDTEIFLKPKSVDPLNVSQKQFIPTLMPLLENELSTASGSLNKKLPSKNVLAEKKNTKCGNKRLSNLGETNIVKKNVKRNSMTCSRTINRMANDTFVHSPVSVSAKQSNFTKPIQNSSFSHPKMALNPPSGSRRASCGSVLNAHNKKVSNNQTKLETSSCKFKRLSLRPESCKSRVNNIKKVNQAFNVPKTSGKVSQNQTIKETPFNHLPCKVKTMPEKKLSHKYTANSFQSGKKMSLNETFSLTKEEERKSSQVTDRRERKSSQVTDKRESKKTRLSGKWNSSRKEECVASNLCGAGYDSSKPVQAIVQKSDFKANSKIPSFLPKPTPIKKQSVVECVGAYKENLSPSKVPRKSFCKRF